MPTAREHLGPLISYLPYSTFTRVQEEVIPTLLEGDANIVVAAPTGSGKTALLEVAMLRLFRDRLFSSAAAGNEARGREYGPERKAVYICPIKALASEKYGLWKEKFPTLSVALETGDQELSRTQEGVLFDVPHADIIITTPERWDSITRRWKEKVVWGLVASVALLLLDEVHTVNEERGAVLEAVVSRMKAIKASMSSRGPRSYSTRFVTISGTLPNIEDFAEWLQVEPGGVFSFTSADRPVPLTLRIISYPSTSNNPFAFDRFLSFKLFGLVRQFSAGRPSIIFCASRSEAINSSLRIATEVRETALKEGAEDRLKPTNEVEQLASSANDKQLRGLLSLGIAYHHAAMSMNDRALVERMFREHYISVICTTTTLALGVNLPAHLVIIKGTTFFKRGRREDLPLSEVAQMSGRAGRPGLDTHGIALVLTTECKAALYEPLRHGDSCSVVESHLHLNMIEHVNAEVALRTIHGFTFGIEWIKTTFLWIRLKRCPRHYGILFSTKEEESSFDREQFAANLMRRMLIELERQGCIATVRHDHPQGATERPTIVDDGNTNRDITNDNFHMDCANWVVESTRIGRAMARRYILFRTVELFNVETLHVRSRSDNTSGATGENAVKLTSPEGQKQETLTGSMPAAFTVPQLLGILSRSAEFEELHLRQGDRKHLNEMNKNIRYPLKSGMRGGREVREDWHKVYVLIQAHLEHMPVMDFSLRNDFVRLWTTAPRLAHFLVDYAGTTNSFSLVKESYLLLRCMEQKMWWDGPVLRQLGGIGESVAKALLRGGIKGIADVLKSDPRRLETLCGKNPPFGNELQDRCRAVPHCGLCLEVSSEDSETVRAVITVTPQDCKERGNKVKYRMIIIAGDTKADTLLLFRQFYLSDAKDGEVVFTFRVPCELRSHVVGHVFTEQHLFGNDVMATLHLGEDKAEEQKTEAATTATTKTTTTTTTKKKKGSVPTKKEESNALDPFPTSAAFDALVRDLRWVEGTSPRHKSDALDFPSRTCHDDDKDATEFPTDAAAAFDGTSGTKCSPEKLQSLSHVAGVVMNKHSSPEAARLSHPSSAIETDRIPMDEDYRQLVERTKCISSNLRFNRFSPAHSFKREREETCTESNTFFQSLRSPFAGGQEVNSSFSRPRESVILPKTVSPEPLGDSSVGAACPRPSARFRFGVQYSAPQERLSEPLFLQSMERRGVFRGNTPTVFPNTGYTSFWGHCIYPAERLQIPPPPQQQRTFVREFYPQPPCHYGGPASVHGQPPQWLRSPAGGVSTHHSVGRDMQAPWSRGVYPSFVVSSAQGGWRRQEWGPPTTSPHPHSNISRTAHNYPMPNNNNPSASSSSVEFRQGEGGGFYAGAAMPVFLRSMPDGRPAGAAPRTTAVQRGWW